MFKFFFAPPDGATTEYQMKFQTADFPIFCARITVIFSATCISREVFFCCCDNGQCDARPVGIAETRSSLCFCIAFVSSMLILNPLLVFDIPGSVGSVYSAR